MTSDLCETEMMDIMTRFTDGRYYKNINPYDPSSPVTTYPLVYSGRWLSDIVLLDSLTDHPLYKLNLSMKWTKTIFHFQDVLDDDRITWEADRSFYGRRFSITRRNDSVNPASAVVPYCRNVSQYYVFEFSDHRWIWRPVSLNARSFFCFGWSMGSKTNPFRSAEPFLAAWIIRTTDLKDRDTFGHLNVYDVLPPSTSNNYSEVRQFLTFTGALVTYMTDHDRYIES